jgi:hypothetical protein
VIHSEHAARRPYRNPAEFAASQSQEIRGTATAGKPIRKRPDF